MEIWLVLAVLTGCMILFIKEIVPVEVVALLGLMSLVILRVLTPDEAFQGFGNPALITIAGVFALSAGLVQTGVADFIGQKIEQFGGSHYLVLLFGIVLTQIVLSAFTNNVAATAVLLPVVTRMAQRLQIHPGKLLMPLAFGSLLGGTFTAIGTSTNMVMSSFLLRNGLSPFGLFEFSPIGFFIAGAGLLYIITIGHRLLPQRGEATLEETYHLREYITEIVILENSPLIGKTIFDTQFAQKLELHVIALIRGKKRYFVLPPEQVLEAGDLLLVEGRIKNILAIKDTFGLDIKPDFKLTNELQGEDIHLAEVVIAPGAELIGKSLKDIRFRQRYNLVVLAVHRRGHRIPLKMSQLPLQLGDVLLVQGREADVRSLRLRPDFLLLEDPGVTPLKKQKARVAVAIFILVLLLGGLGFVPIVVAVIIGALLMVLARVLALSDAYQAINWSTIVLIAGMSSLGFAMEKTGLAQIVASFLVQSLGGFGPRALLAGFFVLTVTLTQPMSNAAAALLVAPIALSTALSLNLDPRPFIITVSLAASCSFLTPLEPACALVYAPGQYHFKDFFRVGSILTLIVMAVILYFVPIFWPL